MARITISGALPFINNKYELGMLAGQRVRDLNGGEQPIIQPSEDKPPVVALREISTGKLDVDRLRREFIQSYKKAPVVDEASENLESEAVAPELRELDEELSGATAIKDEMSGEVADEIAAESEDSSEFDTLETEDKGDIAADTDAPAE